VNLRTREFLADGSFVKVTWETAGQGDDHVIATHFQVHRANQGIVLQMTGCYDTHEGSSRTLTQEELKKVTTWAVSFVDSENEFGSW